MIYQVSDEYFIAHGGYTGFRKYFKNLMKCKLTEFHTHVYIYNDPRFVQLSHHAYVQLINCNMDIVFETKYGYDPKNIFTKYDMNLTETHRKVIISLLNSKYLILSGDKYVEIYCIRNGMLLATYSSKYWTIYQTKHINLLTDIFMAVSLLGKKYESCEELKKECSKLLGVECDTVIEISAEKTNVPAPDPIMTDFESA